MHGCVWEMWDVIGSASEPASRYSAWNYRRGTSREFSAQTLDDLARDVLQFVSEVQDAMGKDRLGA
jgi:hypothetical protein